MNGCNCKHHPDFISKGNNEEEVNFAAWLKCGMSDEPVVRRMISVFLYTVKGTGRIKVSFLTF